MEASTFRNCRKYKYVISAPNVIEFSGFIVVDIVIHNS